MQDSNSYALIDPPEDQRVVKHRKQQITASVLCQWDLKDSNEKSGSRRLLTDLEEPSWWTVTQAAIASSTSKGCFQTVHVVDG